MHISQLKNDEEENTLMNPEQSENQSRNIGQAATAMDEARAESSLFPPIAANRHSSIGSLEYIPDQNI